MAEIKSSVCKHGLFTSDNFSLFVLSRFNKTRSPRPLPVEQVEKELREKVAHCVV